MTPKGGRPAAGRARDPLWYKDAVVYELNVRAFFDGSGDGRGDFHGLAQRLDYVRDLGATALSLPPFYPSPGRDDGYDVADPTGVDPACGTLADFAVFLEEAHRRGLRVVTELVMNHTSDQHPWFQRARRARPGSRDREFYVWSDRRDRYREARVIHGEAEASNWTWDPVAGAYYWHRFHHHEPDLNYKSPDVRRAMTQVVDFWLERGVDGLKLAGVPYLYEREGTSCENLPETHELLRGLRRHVDRRFPDRLLLAGADQWPEDAAAYLGKGDECQMACHLTLMPRMLTALHTEDRYPIVDILAQAPAVPDSCQWALLLRDHDDLTLERVTDEERDYLYRVHATDPQARGDRGRRRRLAPLLGHDRRRIELLNGLLLSLPGTPVLYYGDEIGMGDNVHLGARDGVRTPMQWSADRNAGFSKASPRRVYLPPVAEPGASYEAVNVQAQHDDPQSLLWWMRRLIALRRRHRALSRGRLEMLYPANRKVLAFVRRTGGQAVLVAANLSRHLQCAELDLSAYRPAAPREMLGLAGLPPVGEGPYLLTLAPHALHWFALEAPAGRVEATGADAPVSLTVAGPWRELFEPPGRAAFERSLPRMLSPRRWFSGKGRRVRGAELLDAVSLSTEAGPAAIAIARVDYADGGPETYVLPFAHATGARAAEVRAAFPESVMADLAAQGENGVLYGALCDRGFADSLLDAIAGQRRFPGVAGEIAASRTRAFPEVRGPAGTELTPALMRAEQSNSSIVYGDRLVLKLFRRVEEGTNPDLEIGAFLTGPGAFPHVPPVAGGLEYRPRNGRPMTLAILQGFVRNEGDAWQYTLDSLGRYFERAVCRSAELAAAPLPSPALLDLTERGIPRLAHELIGSYLEAARLLGQRTAEMHLALASAPDDPDFAPEPFTAGYQRSVHDSMQALAREVFAALRRRAPTLPREARREAEAVLERQASIRRRFRGILDRRITAVRTRHHGDYHLGQVLWTGRDFVIIDFEGEPARPLAARRLKRSPLRDVAGMIRSFHYAAFQGRENHRARGGAGEEAVLAAAASLWYPWVSSSFLRSYLRSAGEAPFVPRAREERERLLTAYLLEKAVYELGYELNNRPPWVRLPLQGIAQLTGTVAA